MFFHLLLISGLHFSSWKLLRFLAAAPPQFLGRNSFVMNNRGGIARHNGLPVFVLRNPLLVVYPATRKASSRSGCASLPNPTAGRG
jgi:hypothetical protein